MTSSSPVMELTELNELNELTELDELDGMNELNEMSELEELNKKDMNRSAYQESSLPSSSSSMAVITTDISASGVPVSPVELPSTKNASARAAEHLNMAQSESRFESEYEPKKGAQTAETESASASESESETKAKTGTQTTETESESKTETTTETAENETADTGTCTSSDPRIARSKAALREALIELIEERGLDGFTVGDLCVRAGLNRGTFYNHFKDKENLLATFEDEIMDSLEGFRTKMQDLEIRDLVYYRARKKPLPVLVELFDYLRDEGAFIHAVLGPGGDVRFGVRLRETVCEGLIRSLLHERYRESDDSFVGYYISYFAGAYLGVIERWISTGMHESSEEMAQVALRLFFIKPGESIKM